MFLSAHARQRGGDVDKRLQPCMGIAWGHAHGSGHAAAVAGALLMQLRPSPTTWMNAQTAANGAPRTYVTAGIAAAMANGLSREGARRSSAPTLRVKVS